MEITLPLEKMTTAEKLRVMETLWADLTRDADRFESPAWHEDVLRARDEALRSGKEKPLDWEATKAQLRRLRP